MGQDFELAGLRVTLFFRRTSPLAGVEANF